MSRLCNHVTSVLLDAVSLTLASQALLNSCCCSAQTHMTHELLSSFVLSNQQQNSSCCVITEPTISMRTFVRFGFPLCLTLKGITPVFGDPEVHQIPSHRAAQGEEESNAQRVRTKEVEDKAPPWLDPLPAAPSLDFPRADLLGLQHQAAAEQAAGRS